MMKCMGIVWYNISKNRPRWKRFFCAPGGGVDTFIFSDFEPWNFVIALYKVVHVKCHCYSSWAFICSKVELLTRTWALTLMHRTLVTSYLNHLLINNFKKVTNFTTLLWAFGLSKWCTDTSDTSGTGTIEHYYPQDEGSRSPTLTIALHLSGLLPKIHVWP